tara:strand:- start:249 stop:557 length:309 start_codon:yes stop_codon:yes gene_type:complete
MKITKQRLKQIIKEELENFEEVEKMSSAQYASELGAEKQAGAAGVSDEEKKLLMDLHRTLKLAAQKTNLMSGGLAPFVQKLQGALKDLLKVDKKDGEAAPVE